MQIASEHPFRTFYIKINLAGINIMVEFNSIDELASFRGYLCSFTEPDFIVRASLDEIEKDNSIFKTQNNYDDAGHILGVESQIIQRKIVEKMISYNTFLMHGSVVALDNQAYMFTAPSGTGKSTRTRLWLDEYPSSIVVNGDKPFIKVTDTDILACGTPWCGKEGWNTNTMVPLRAIFLLERADKDSIEEISMAQAFPTILQQINRPADPSAMRKTIELLKAFENRIKIYRFCSSPTSESVRLAYETARPR